MTTNMVNLPQIPPVYATTASLPINASAGAPAIVLSTPPSIYIFDGAAWNLVTSGGATSVTSITGTANQIIASAASGAVVLSTPQNINSTATPTFGGITLTTGANTGYILTCSTSGGIATWTAPSVSGITTLTGDVSATGSGSVTATIQPNVVTYSKLQQVGISSLVGNPTGSLANAQGITLGSNLSFVSSVLTLSSAPSFSTITLTTGATSNYVLTCTNGTGLAAWAINNSITALTGDVAATGPGSVAATIQPNVVSYAKFQQVALNSLVGNPTGSLANAQAITLGTNLSFVSTVLTLSSSPTFLTITLTTGASSGYILTSGSGGLAAWAPNTAITSLSGDVVATGPGAVAATIQANVVSYSKLQQVAANTLVGNPTGSLANAQDVSLGASLAFSAGLLTTVQAITTASSPTFAAITLSTGAATGYILTSTNSSGVAAWASVSSSIATNSITYAQIQQVAASKLLGNPTGVLANVSEITLGANLAFSGTALNTVTSPTFSTITLSTSPTINYVWTCTSSSTGAGSWQAAAASGITALTTDVVASGSGSVVATIQANVVTYAKFQQVAASSLVANPTGSLANAQATTLGTSLAFSGTTLNTIQAITSASTPTFASIVLSTTPTVGYVWTATSVGGAGSWQTTATTGITALTTDVVASGVGSVAATIQANVVTYAKFQQVAALSLVGNPNGSLTNASAITLGTSLAFSAGSLNTVQAITTASTPSFASITLTTGAATNYIWTSTNTTGIGSWQPAAASGITALTTDVVASGSGSVTATIQAGVVTYAKMQTIAPVSLIGNATGSTATATGITLGTSLAFSGSTVNTIQAITTASSPSFASITLSTAATVGYVWTATSVGGAGSWQVASGGSTSFATVDAYSANFCGGL